MKKFFIKALVIILLTASALSVVLALCCEDATILGRLALAALCVVTYKASETLYKRKLATH